MVKKTPKEGSRAWERTFKDNPGYAKEAIESLTRRAAEGEPGAAKQLAGWLDLHPQFRPAVEAVTDLAARAQETWVKLAAGGDRLAEQAAREEAEAIRAELLPPDAGVVERVLVSTVVVSRLVLTHATTLAAIGSPNAGVVAGRDRRLTAAQSRLFAAVKGWEAVAAKRLKGVRPTIKLFDTAKAAGA